MSNLIWVFCVGSLICCVVLNVSSSFSIIWLSSEVGMELSALLLLCLLSYGCVLCLFLSIDWVDLQSVFVAPLAFLLCVIVLFFC